MNKILLAVLSALLLSACGVGNYSLSSGKADVSMLSFVSAEYVKIKVSVDDKSYDLLSVKDKAWKTDRKIKPTAKNTILLTSGTHEVAVSADGSQIYSKKIFVSASEHKIVEL